MKNVLLFFGVIAFFLSSCGNGGGSVGKAVALTTQMDSISYAIGQNWGNLINQNSEDSDGTIEFNMDAVYYGIAES